MEIFRTVPLSSLQAIERQKNPVFDTPIGSLKNDEIYFTVEIPKGSMNKYELRTATGQVILDRVICPKSIPETGKQLTGFPLHYGISAGRFSEGKDPIDVIVFGSDGMYSNMVWRNSVSPRKIRVIGTAKFQKCDNVPCREDMWKDDWKIIGVDVADIYYGKRTEFHQLDDRDIEGVTTFFSHYKGLKDGHPQSRIAGFVGKKDSLEILGGFKAVGIVERSREVELAKRLFGDILKNRSAMQKLTCPPVSEDFVYYLNRVFDSRFFESEEAMEFFLRYSAYQLLHVELSRNDATLDNAIEIMASLKEQSKKHYRFVSFDRPRTRGHYASQGSRNLIFEWVKTKNRNHGCDPGFPKQHYEDNPVVDV
ncbi:MAG: inorganic diphosphatase [Oligoflexales bacterium]